MHFNGGWRGEGKTLGDSKAKISLGKHFRFLSRIMDCSQFDCILLLMWIKNGFAQNTRRVHRVSVLAGLGPHRRHKYSYHIIVIHFGVVQSLFGNESRAHRTLYYNIMCVGKTCAGGGRGHEARWRPEDIRVEIKVSKTKTMIVHTTAIIYAAQFIYNPGDNGA